MKAQNTFSIWLFITILATQGFCGREKNSEVAAPVSSPEEEAAIMADSKGSDPLLGKFLNCGNGKEIIFKTGKKIELKGFDKQEDGAIAYSDSYRSDEFPQRINLYYKNQNSAQINQMNGIRYRIGSLNQYCNLN